MWLTSELNASEEVDSKGQAQLMRAGWDDGRAGLRASGGWLNGGRRTEPGGSEKELGEGTESQAGRNNKDTLMS